VAMLKQALFSLGMIFATIVLEVALYFSRDYVEFLSIELLAPLMIATAVIGLIMSVVGYWWIGWKEN